MGSHLKTEFLVVGGSLGGCFAAMTLAGLGRKVILTSTYRTVGGQFVTQAVPPDEHPWIESFGCTRRYRRLRELTRERFRMRPHLRESARSDPLVNPGRGWVSRLCAEPQDWLEALDLMFLAARTEGSLDVMTGHVPTGCEVAGERVLSISFTNRETGEWVEVEADYFLDATELGDLLELTGAEYRVGAESVRETGEPHASQEEGADDVQGFTWCAALEYDPDASEPIERPHDYDFWSNYIPEDWPGPLIGPEFPDVRTGDARRLEFLNGELSLFSYRRIVDPKQFDAEMTIRSATIVNWPQNDYFLKNILDKSPEYVDEALKESRQLTLSLIYWLQTECGLTRLQPSYDLHFGEGDSLPGGLALEPYFRESRRIVGVTTLSELEVGAECNPGANKAAERSDSIGIGAYRIDLHPTPSRGYLDLGSLPYQIPIGCLVPVRMRNLLPACKNISVTHIANGCTRLHPVEANIGESAALLAYFCMERLVDPIDVALNPGLTAELQEMLVGAGIELSWPNDVHPL